MDGAGLTARVFLWEANWPRPAQRKGKILKFSKSLFAYNGHRIREPVRDLCVVEGFPSVWWLHQSGLPDTVALMEDAFSAVQLVTKRLTRLVEMPDGKQPTYLAPGIAPGGPYESAVWRHSLFNG